MVGSSAPWARVLRISSSSALMALKLGRSLGLRVRHLRVCVVCVCVCVRVCARVCACVCVNLL